jgi:hypothetical protein
VTSPSETDPQFQKGSSGLSRLPAHTARWGGKYLAAATPSRPLKTNLPRVPASSRCTWRLLLCRKCTAAILVQSHTHCNAHPLEQHALGL